jgi:hypothetical protein
VDVAAARASNPDWTPDPRPVSAAGVSLGPTLGGVVPGDVVAGAVVSPGVGLPDGVGVEVGSGIGTPEPVASTWRNLSSAVVPTSRTSSSSFTPGTDTTIVFEPWVVTSDSATPEPSTRDRMISTAVFNASGVTSPPSVWLAVRVIDVPPCRSSPSRGLAGPSRANIRPPRATTTSRKMMRVRPGCEALVGGGATERCSLGLG